jgi:DNA-binding XRE family transcriptional regulator
MNIEQEIDIVLTEYNFDRMSFDEAKQSLLRKFLTMKVKLKEVRESVNMSIEELAERSLTSCAKISRIEKGLELADIGLQQRISNALGVSKHEIFN